MATNFPGSLDNFTNPVAGDSQNSPSHSLQHADANDAIEALEAKVGIGNSPAGSATAGRVLVAGTGGTTTWTTVGTAGINSTGASAGQVLTANASGAPSWVTPAATNDAWVSYTPTLTASTTNPTLGTGSAAVGSYVKFGKTVIGQVSIIFGTSGANAGSGTYYISLPINRISTNENAIGSVVMRDASASYIGVSGTLQGLGSDAGKALIVFGSSTFGVSNTAPWTWAASDQIFVSFMYETA